MLNVTDIGPVRVITINRPERRNALDDATVTELREVVRASGGDAGVRALVVAGQGEVAFCSGSDMKAARDMTVAERISHAQNGQELMDEIHATPLLTIAAVEGWALGGGLELALACDVIIASPTGKFGLPEVQKGAIPSWGGTHRLTRAIGLAVAKNMLLGGRVYTAAEAHHAGWLLEVVPAGTTVPRAAEIAVSMTEVASRELLATAKNLLNAGAHRSPVESSVAEFAAERMLAGLDGYGISSGGTQ